jgi:hypothetical protein
MGENSALFGVELNPHRHATAMGYAVSQPFASGGREGGDGGAG